jgi:hypothetical protein
LVTLTAVALRLIAPPELKDNAVFPLTLSSPAPAEIIKSVGATPAAAPGMIVVAPIVVPLRAGNLPEAALTPAVALRFVEDIVPTKADRPLNAAEDTLVVALMLVEDMFATKADTPLNAAEDTFPVAEMFVADIVGACTVLLIIADTPLISPAEEMLAALTADRALKLLTIADVPDNVGACKVVVNIPDEPLCAPAEDISPRDS